jgi:hypothetical protein
VGVDTPRSHRRKVTIPTAPVRKIELRRMGA